MYEPCTFATPCARKRPSGELRVQYELSYVTSCNKRNFAVPTSQPSPNACDDASGLSARHCFGSVAVPQPYIAIMLPRFTARQPCVDIAVTCAATSEEIPGVQVDGAGSAGNVSSSSGRPRANHSATMSNCSCV